MKQLFFDLDHTLWDFEQNAFDCIVEIFDLLNLHQKGINPVEFYLAFSVINRNLWHELEQNLISHEKIRNERFKLSFAQTGLEISSEQSIKCNQLFLDLLPSKKKLIDGCYQILENLSATYRLHIISNGYLDIQNAKLEAGGILHFFDKIITNDTAGMRKPDPGIFRYALNLTDCLPQNGIMIGDSYHADILGAHGAGMQAIHFSHEPAIETIPNYLHINRLTDIKKHL